MTTSEAISAEVETEPRLSLTPEGIRSTLETKRLVESLGIRAIEGDPHISAAADLIDEFGSLTRVDVRAIAEVIPDALRTGVARDSYQARLRGVEQLGLAASAARDEVSLSSASSYLRYDLRGRAARRAAKKLDKHYPKK